MSDDEDDPKYVWGRRRRKQAQSEENEDGFSIERTKAVAIAKAQRDINELDIPSSIVVNVTDPLHLSIVITPDEGFWYGGSFEFTVEIPSNYPFAPPIVTCIDPIWHPNIDLNGKPCVNVLQNNWKPTFTLNTIMYGLLFLFTDPNPSDPLNPRAADQLRLSPGEFRDTVILTLIGNVTVESKLFPPNRHGDPSKYGRGKIR